MTKARKRIVDPMAIIALTMTMAATSSSSSVQAQRCQPQWSEQFAPAMDGGAQQMAEFDDGSGGGPALFVAGQFSYVEGVEAKGIAKYDGAKWTPLADGLSGGEMLTMGVFDLDRGEGSALYVGGYIVGSGSLSLNGIGKWDGKSWSSLGGGLSGPVRALAAFDDGSGTGTSLFAGGLLSTANDPFVLLMKWDGATWTPVVGDFGGEANAMAVFDDGSGSGPALYVAGYFHIGSAPNAEHIAKWDGRQWTMIASSVNNETKSLCVFDDGLGAGPALYAAGTLTTIDGATVNRIARWNGQAWTSVGGGVSGTAYVKTLTSHDDGSGPGLYACGNFNVIGGVSTKGIAKWNGVRWEAFGNGLKGVSCAGFVNTDAGEQVVVGGGPAKLARWTGSQWLYFGSGIAGTASTAGYDDTYIFAMATFDDGSGQGPALFVAGDFSTAGSIDASAIAKWDGKNWSALDSGFTSSSYVEVLALQVFDDGQGGGPQLYAGGYFTEAGGVHAYSIARWNGKEWSPVTDLYNGEVYALAVYDDGSGPHLYASGTFNLNGILNHVAKWDGKQWLPLGAGINGAVYTLAAFEDATGPALYAAGKFTQAGGASANRIAKWNGKEWSALGNGIGGPIDSAVYALAVYDDGQGQGPGLYVGGYYTTAGPISAAGIARWKGQTWSPLAGGSGVAYQLVVFDDGYDDRPALYAGGGANIGRWNGAFWTYVNPQMNWPAGQIFSITTFDDHSGDGPALFVAGSFQQAGGYPASNITKYVGCPINDPPSYHICRYKVDIIESPPSACTPCSPTINAVALTHQGRMLGDYGYNGDGLFTWDETSGLTIMPPMPDFGDAVAGAMNSSNQMAGMRDQHAFSIEKSYFYDGTQWIYMQDDQNAPNCVCTSMNDSAQIAGYRGGINSNFHNGFRWQNGVFTDITAEDSDIIEPSDLNEAGVVVGSRQITDSGKWRGFIWDGSRMTDLIALPGSDECRATAINNRNQIVGSSTVPNGGQIGIKHAVLWNGGRPIDLGTIPNFTGGVATDINDRGEIVGHFTSGNSPYGAFVWRDGVMTGLNQLIPADIFLTVYQPVAINDAGRIAIRGQLFGTGPVAVLLTPVTPSIADINGDCVVDGDDLLLLIYEWGDGNSIADLNADGTVNVDDLLILIQSWG